MFILLQSTESQYSLFKIKMKILKFKVEIGKSVLELQAN